MTKYHSVTNLDALLQPENKWLLDKSVNPQDLDKDSDEYNRFRE